MRFLILLFLFLASFRGIAQQTPQFSQFMMNRFLYNPAFAGFEDYWDVQSGFRTQWTGINTANRTFYTTANFAFDKSDRTSTGITPYMSKTIRRNYSPTYIRKKTRKVNFHQGVGMQLLSDQIGPVTSMSLSGTYAYHLSLGGERKLATGGSIGYYQRVLDMTNFNVRDAGDPFITYSNSSGLPAGRISGGQSLINVGALYYTRKFYVGLSANQPVFGDFFFTNKSSDNGQATRDAIYDPLIAEVSADETIDPDRKLWLLAQLNFKKNGATQWMGTVAPTVFFQAGGDIRSGEHWTYSPAVLVKYMKGATLVAEANMRVKYDEQFWVGGTYRHKDAIGIMVGAHVSNALNLTYVYEMHSNGYARQSMGSHEIVLGMKFRNRIFMSNPAY
ncbi:PorP/SprF family type IX secretion system membrane protein [Aquirufa sp. OSTEICH-129V]|jgi:type IX secretion system PorP/SprF family membrane protein|uniref:PorP/SprF family type IX secretion system membrane protein n=1 Tax=Aquirufa avitistagni TaxID=3104728 RepID=A0ABW6DFT5_9BACT